MADVAEGAGGFLKTKRLTEFQAEGVLTAFQRDGHVLVWDCGVGKSVGAMATAVLCFQEDVIDRVLVVCERNKVREWMEDFFLDTDLTVHRHHGGNRWKALERAQKASPSGRHPQVLVTTYETAKRDMATPRGPRSFDPGRLLKPLLGERVLVIYDESTKLRNRSSGNYKAHQYMLNELRKAARTKVLGLTGTPLERSYEDGFNQFRLVVPEHMPKVKDFESDCVLYRDPFGRPTYNLMEITKFVERVQPHMTRKRKTDPDVIEQFPPLVEEYRYITLGQAHREFYQMAEELVLEDQESDTAAWMLLRQIAGHPASLIHSESSKYARKIVEVLGAEALQKIGSAKAEELKGYLNLVVNDQKAKAVVFTFFGQSVLRELERELHEDRFLVFPYHGGQTAHENEMGKKLFQECEGGAVLLASDAGARGINLPEATYVIEYESALTHASRIQRRDRAHRLSSRLGPVTATTFIAEGTVEEAIFANVLRRNEEHDHFTGDAEAGEEFVSAADRRQILEEARQRARSRRKS